MRIVLNLFIILILMVSCNQISKDYQTNITPSNLPVFVINPYGEQIIREPKTNARLVVIEPSGEEIKLNIKIDERGMYSGQIPKKQYGFEIIDDNFNDLDYPLLGLNAESDWVLHGPYSDKSLLRNYLAYYLSRQMGQYASNARFVEVYLHDESRTDSINNYQGIYVLLEKIKRSPARVNISKLNTENPSFEDLSFILELTPSERIDRADTPIKLAVSGNYLSFIYPNGNKVSETQMHQIKRFFNDFERALYSGKFDSISGYKKFVDLESLVDFVVFNEFAKNTDAFHASTYLYKDKGGKLKFGPVWDYNIAFGNVDYSEGKYAQGWYLPTMDRNWIKQFFEDEEFVKMFKERWHELGNTVYKDDIINDEIDNQLVYLEKARERNFTKWDIIGKKLWPNPDPIPQTYNNEIKVLKFWIKKRIDWINQHIDELE